MRRALFTAGCFKAAALRTLHVGIRVKCWTRQIYSASRDQPEVRLNVERVVHSQQEDNV